MITEVTWTGKALLLFLILFLASYSDVKTRIVSDRYSIFLIMISFIPPEPFRASGLFCSIPFLIAAITSGGIGGADIKIMSAAGTILGITGGMAAMIIGLTGMLIFHKGSTILSKSTGRETGKAYPLIPFLTAGILIVYLSKYRYLFML